LDIVLPDGARLWTALVKGLPVKPVEHPQPTLGKMRIPLVKSPAGSGDYSVEIKYGGQLPPLRTARSISFPLIRTERINVETSQVQLYLPDNYTWPNFGGTMSRVKSEEELEEGLQGYFQKKVNEAKLALQSDDLNTKLRAQANISGLLQTWQFNSSGRSVNNLKQSGLALSNYADLQQAQQDAQAEVQQQLEGDAESDNRSNINRAWSSKTVTRSKNVAAQFGNNFDQPAKDASPANNEAKGKGELAYNPQFLKGNKLYTEESNEKVIQEELTKQLQQQKERQPAQQPAATKPGDSKPNAAQPQPQPQGRISRGGQQQQAIQDLEGSRGGLNRELRDFAEKPSQSGEQSGGGRGGPNQGDRGQPNSGYGNFHGPARNAQPGGGPGRGMGGGQSEGQQPQELAQNNDQTRQRDNAFRYQQKLEQEQQQGQALQRFNNNPQARPQTAAPKSPFDDDGPGFSLGLTPTGPTADLDFRFNNPTFSANQPTMGGFNPAIQQSNPGFAPPGTGATVQAPTGLASLDIAIPQRGNAFLFTMPRGDIEITAVPASRDLLFRLTKLGIIAALIAAGVILYRIFSQLSVRQATGTFAFAILLMLVGFMSLLANVLPYFGGILFLVGLVLLVLRLIYKRNVMQPV
jgi:hypothetical protein